MEFFPLNTSSTLPYIPDTQAVSNDISILEKSLQPPVDLLHLRTTCLDPRVQEGISVQRRLGGRWWTMANDAPIDLDSLREHSNPSTPVLRRLSNDPAAPKIPPVPLNSKLQSYFMNMRRGPTHALHPTQIRASAQSVVTYLTSKGYDASPMGDVADLLFFLGIQRREFASSIALLVHEVLALLQGRRALGIKFALHKHFEDLAVRTFLTCWHRGCNNLSHLDTPDGLVPHFDIALESQRTCMLNLAAFVGSLTAFGVVAPINLHACAEYLLFGPALPLHLRALHLLLIHAGRCAGGLNVSFLRYGRAGLVELARDLINLGSSEPSLDLKAVDDMQVLWLIEVCTVLEAAIDAVDAGVDASRTEVVWDRTLECDDLLALCPVQDQALHHHNRAAF
ncbi:hypothetical protein BC834DRAFT_973571 [Gloeopeniophorella convolvens]|nr:hypothetical protein BC834DRAFT_973571 [Gloeopeniophorella convolvens]